MPGRDPMTAAAERICRENPDHPARGLARMLVEHSRRALTLEQARRRIRYVLGQNGTSDRKRAKSPRDPRAPGQTVAMPASIAEPWTPHALNVTGRVGILSDVHVPYHSDVAVAAAVDHLKSAGLAALVMNGDIADFYSISRWQKDPSQRDFRGELEAVRQFLAWIRSQFPTITIIYKSGNHEERWTHYIWQHAPELSAEPMMSLTAWLKLADVGIELVEDQRPVMLGRLPVFHGHELPRGIASPVNPARGAFTRLQSTGLVGHYHRSSSHSESDWRHHEQFNWSTGCLCDLTPEYARINKWNHGAAIVTVHEDESFDVENFRISPDGKVRTS